MARIVFTLEDGTELETELDADVITIGRHADSIVVLPSGSVSSHHATIKRRGESFYVQDLGTTNGTRLNGVDVEEAKLEHGDQVTFGDVAAVVYLTDEPTPVVSAIPLPSTAIPADVKQAPPKVGGGRAVVPPPRGRQTRAYARPQYKESGGCAGFLTFLFFLVLAFLIGLHARHGVVTGRFLAKDVIIWAKEKWGSKTEQPEGTTEPAKPADGGTTPPAGGSTPAPAGTPAPGPAPAPAPGGAPAPTPAPGAAPSMDMNMNAN